MTRPVGWLIALMALGLASTARGQGPNLAPGEVDPARLGKDPSLVGREVVVDDRVRFFQPHKGPKGQEFDELYLKRTEVPFRLPPLLRPESPPKAPVARVRGTLRGEGRQAYVDVTTLEMMPSDLDRVDREVRRLRPDDSAARAAWGAWASRRAVEQGEPELAARGTALEAEAIRLEAARPGADALALAHRARSSGQPELAGALAHRGLRDRLAGETSALRLDRLLEAISAELPGSADPPTGRPVPLAADLRSRLAADPIATYPQQAPEVRAAIDRTLYADAAEWRFLAFLAEAPANAPTLAEEAAARLPDRPDLARRLRAQGLADAEAGVGGMRLSEVEALAATFRGDGDPERGEAVVKAWLAEQRKRLNGSDVDGHIILAGQYERLLGDRTRAADLLRDALRIEPDSRAVVDAFRRMSYRKTPEGVWYDPAANRDSDPAAAAARTDPRPTAKGAGGDSLLGVSAERVLQTLGKPDRVARSATQDATIEQWTYRTARVTRVVDIRRIRGRGQPEVVGDFTLP